MNMSLRTRDTVPAITGAAATLLVLGLILWMMVSLVGAGLPELSLKYLVSAPADSGLSGGIGPILVNTLLILLVCLAVVIPAGLAAALCLSELLPRTHPLALWLGWVLDVLASVPSIVFALFGYQFFAITLGMGFSILSGGLTLACMALPLMVRTSEQALRAVPASWRQAGHAMALSQSGMLRQVVLPAAAPGIAAAVILSTGRALAETAVLLFTAGYVMRMPDSLLDSGRALSVHIYDLAMHVPDGDARASSAALVLVFLILIINLVIHRLARYGGISHAR